MAVLNLRGVPDELAKRLKSEAALVGISLREYCVGILGCAMAVADKKWPWDGYGVSGAGSGVSRKIAESSVGAVAQDEGVAPEEALPRGGKAQDEAQGLRDEWIYERLGIARDFNEVHIPARQKFPEWSEARMREMAEAEPGGLMACSPELLREMKEQAKNDGGVAAKLHLAGVELDREILVRWGLVENKLEDQDGATDDFAGRAEKREGGGIVGGNSSPDADGAHGSENGSVGVGKPEVNMEALRNICAGNIPAGDSSQAFETFKIDHPHLYRQEPHEVDLCGFKSFNETDGEWYMCCKEKHEYPKVRHGEWQKL